MLRGNTGVTLALALNNYLKYDLNISISWGRNSSGILAKLPAKFPLPAEKQRTVVPMKWRYSWNVCTPGYSFVWYSADQWQFMIDWMALQGVNLPLAFNGQEAVFAQVFSALGLTDAGTHDLLFYIILLSIASFFREEIWAYFSGPAFLPWNRMGNMQAWGALNSQVPDPLPAARTPPACTRSPSEFSIKGIFFCKPSFSMPHSLALQSPFPRFGAAPFIA